MSLSLPFLLAPRVAAAGGASSSPSAEMAESDAEFIRALRWFEHLPCCLAFLRAGNYGVAYVNAAWRGQTGRKQMNDMPFFEVWPEFEAQGVRALFDRALKRARPYVGRGRAVVVRRRDGTYVRHVVDVVLQPVRAPSGRVFGLLVQASATPIASRGRAGREGDAGRDPLTGLPNDATFRNCLDVALRTQGMRGGGIVLALDINRFRQVNACVGRAAGDDVLREIAARVTLAAGPQAVVARAGADRFLVLVSNLVPAQADALVPTLVAALAEPFRNAGAPLHLTCSVGVARFPEHGQEADRLMTALDRALADARQAGPGAIRAGVRPDEREAERFRIAAALHDALDRDALAVHYQPQVDLASGRMCGVEALVRWRDPVMGDVPADLIIGIAEATGLIGQLGDWVLRMACVQMQAWRAMGFGHLRVAVNLSSRQFAMRDLESTVMSALRDTGLPPACLDLELTESLLMVDVEHAITCLQGLRRHGIRLSLDDFGTGYSSLSYLRRFPIDTLKIDRSFMRTAPACARAAGLVEAIVAMGHSLGMRVIAEGVESDSQVRLLVGCGCDEMQGYLFSRPLAAEQMTALLRSGRTLATSGPDACRHGVANSTIGPLGASR